MVGPRFDAIARLVATVGTRHQRPFVGRGEWSRRSGRGEDDAVVVCAGRCGQVMNRRGRTIDCTRHCQGCCDDDLCLPFGVYWPCGASGPGSDCTRCAASQVCGAGGAPGVCGGCTPNCTGKKCGDDGCFGVCGTCDDDEICSGGVCRSSVEGRVGPWTQTASMP